MSTLNSRRDPNVCLWCGKVQSIDHNCEMVPDFNCWFSFGEEDEGVAFVKVSTYGMQHVEEVVLQDEALDFGAYNLFDEVSEPNTCNVEDEVEVDAHHVFAKIPEPSPCLIQTEMMKINGDTLILPDDRSLAIPYDNYDECELMEPILSSDEFQMVMIYDKATQGYKNHVLQAEVKGEEQIVGLFDKINDIFEVQSEWNLVERVQSPSARKLLVKMPEPKSKVMTFEPLSIFVFDPGVLFLHLDTNPYTRLNGLKIGWKTNVNYKEVHSWGKLYVKLARKERRLDTVRLPSTQCYGICYLLEGLIRCNSVMVFKLDENDYTQLVKLNSKGLVTDMFKFECLFLAGIHLCCDRICCISLCDHVENMEAFRMGKCDKIGLGSKETSYLYELSLNHSSNVIHVLVVIPVNNTQWSSRAGRIYYNRLWVVPEFFQHAKVIIPVFFFSLTLEDKGDFMGDGMVIENRNELGEKGVVNHNGNVYHENGSTNVMVRAKSLSTHIYQVEHENKNNTLTDTISLDAPNDFDSWFFVYGSRESCEIAVALFNCGMVMFLVVHVAKADTAALEAFANFSSTVALITGNGLKIKKQHFLFPSNTHNAMVKLLLQYLMCESLQHVNVVARLECEKGCAELLANATLSLVSTKFFGVMSWQTLKAYWLKQFLEAIDEVWAENNLTACCKIAIIKTVNSFPFDPGEWNHNPSIFKNAVVVSSDQHGSAIVVVWVFDPGGYYDLLWVPSSDMLNLDPCANDQELRKTEQPDCILEGAYGSCHIFVFDPGGSFMIYAIDEVTLKQSGRCCPTIFCFNYRLLVILEDKDYFKGRVMIQSKYCLGVV